MHDLFPILAFLGFFALVFGIVYLQKKENLAMIDKGMNPKQTFNRPAPYNSLKFGLLLVGAGLGLFFAYLFDQYMDTRSGPPTAPIYFSLIAIGGGLGLIISYLVEKKDLLSHKNVG